MRPPISTSAPTLSAVTLAGDGSHSPTRVRRALAALALSSGLAALGTSITNVGLPALAQAFEASFAQVQWVVLAYLIVVTVLVAGAGRLGDLVGRRRLLIAGIGVFTLASALCGLAPTLGVLVAARALQGTGAAVMMALAIAFVADTVPKARAGSAMGLLGTVSAVGTALGPALGGLLIAGVGWRGLFAVQLPLGLLALWFAQRGLPPDHLRPAAVRPAVDRLAIFREPLRRTGLVSNALVCAVMMATLVVGPFHLARGLGLDAGAVGFAMAVGPLVAALTGLPAGRWADRIGAAHAIRIGLAAMFAAAMALALLPQSLGVTGYLLPLAALTAAYALFQAANNGAVMAGAGSDERGAVSGLLGLSRNLGLIGGASLMGGVFAFASATGDMTTAAPEVVAAGMRHSFAAAAGLIAMALALTLSVHRRPGGRMPAAIG